MVIISNFIKHSDYSALKQKSRHTASLSVPAGTYGDGQQFSTTFTVPAGVYVENVNLQTSLSAGDNFPCNMFVYQNVGTGLMVFSQCHQLNNTTYRLLATIGAQGGGTVSVPAFTANAILNLSISPFD